MITSIKTGGQHGDNRKTTIRWTTQRKTSKAREKEVIFLFLAIMALALMQPQGNRRTACCLFAGSIYISDLLCGDLPGEVYFFADAVSSALCFVLLDKMKPKPFAVYVLQLFCAASIILNFVGWRLFEDSMSATPYVVSFQVYHLMAVIVFMYWGPYDYIKRAWNSGSFLLFDNMGSNFYLEAKN